MRSFPRIGCRRASAALVVLALGVGLLSVLTGPQATAGELHDRKQAVQKQIEKANHEFDESSARLRRATQALSHAREQLTQARAELGDVRARLALARQRDEEMKAALAEAEARLDQARTDVANGKQALQDQRDLVVDTITSIYQQGDPSLMAFTSILNAQTPADLTRQQEANSSLVDRQDNAYDDLRAAEVLLKVHEDEVADATAEVAEKRQEAAEHLVEMEQLTDEALSAKQRVQAMVGQRKDAESAAFRARQKDRKALAALKRQEDRIDKLIQEAIRKARAKAAANAKKHGRPVDTNGLLMHPVNGPVTSPFGYRIHPIYHYWGLHDGVDFGAGCGANLYASHGGKVLSEYYSSVWGNRLYLNVGMINGKFITLIYNHLSRYRVGVGTTVSRGEVVGYVGTTGWSTGCHLHFTVMENGKPVDPQKYF
ncbi:peptidoglycan DD-metalloendopeptidase family protein [Nocardioides agariphilus]|uniref:Peptidoglycan DD-metalloendopeptidase family protein n=1 Tax=Nocardioides agariphilus TaxID=433664 RepID=A0A930VNX3_9ACTN|nr:peptidoglycan DD-metalloendopeptidase family protein [Nocardioides agariphilus]